MTEMTDQKSDGDSLTRIKLEVAKIDLKLKDAESKRARLKQLRGLVEKLDEDITQAEAADA